MLFFFDSNTPDLTCSCSGQKAQHNKFLKEMKDLGFEYLPLSGASTFKPEKVPFRKELTETFPEFLERKKQIIEKNQTAKKEAEKLYIQNQEKFLKIYKAPMNDARQSKKGLVCNSETGEYVNVIPRKPGQDLEKIKGII